MNENQIILTRLSIAILISLVAWFLGILFPIIEWACPWFIYRSSARNYSKRFSET